jgi:hypothetical protein
MMVQLRTLLQAVELLRNRMMVDHLYLAASLPDERLSSF